MKTSICLTGSLLPLALGLAAQSAAVADDRLVELQFAGEIAGVAADCERIYDGIGAGSTAAGMADFRVYVSHIRLLNDAGQETPLTLIDHGPWQHGDVALLDFENGNANCTNGTAQTNSIVRGMVPDGEYTGIAFDIGVPFEDNHRDPTLAPSPLNLTALFWNWRGGYRFVRVDLLPQTDQSPPGTDAPTMAQADQKMPGRMPGNMPGGMGAGKHGNKAAGWALHIGSTGCRADTPTKAPDSCQAPNRIAVSFTGLDPQSATFVIDPAKVLAQADVTYNTEGTSPGCMSSPKDPECASIWPALGLSAERAEQQLVSVR